MHIAFASERISRLTANLHTPSQCYANARAAEINSFERRSDKTTVFYLSIPLFIIFFIFYYFCPLLSLRALSGLEVNAEDTKIDPLASLFSKFSYSCKGIDQGEPPKPHSSFPGHAGDPV